MQLHIRGLPEIKYEALRLGCDHFFDIPSIALKSVLELLAEIEFVRLMTEGRRIKSVIPQIPPFDDVYERIGEFTRDEVLNEHEQLSLAILNELREKPENKDRLQARLGAEAPTFARCLTIGFEGGLVSEHRARGRSMLLSPFYFGDSLDELAQLAARAGSDELARVIKIIERNQGWPLSLITSRAEIGGERLTPAQQDLVTALAAEGVLKPPTIAHQQQELRFIFTPRPGKGRLTASNREIYERAMALVCAVRKGQLLPEAYKIHWPLKILSALRDRGHIRANTEAAVQYRNLVALRVGVLKPAAQPGWMQFHLKPGPENRAALDLAINLLQTGQLAAMEVKQDARIALAQGEKYIQSLVAASEIRKREKRKLDQEAAAELEQFIFQFDA